nr:hypothetical protein [Tanacetum cinerariifolium]
MGGSSSQRPKYPLMPPIHAFPVEEMYTPQFSDTFKENTSYSQELNREESPIEAEIAWTDGEEYALAKGWVDVSKHSKLGNSRKEAGFGVRFWRIWRANQNSTAVERMIWRVRNGRRLRSQVDRVNLGIVLQPLEPFMTLCPPPYWEPLYWAPTYCPLLLSMI